MRVPLFLWTLPIFFGLGACSSTESEVSAPEMATVNSGLETNLQQNNPYEWSNSDIQRGEDGNFTGGKRSHYDQKKIASYGKNRKAPGYFSRDYHSKVWNGSKDYSTGSFQREKSYQEANKRSWFGGEKSRSDGKIAQGSRTSYQTGSYRKGSANESGQSIQVPHSGYLRSRRRAGRKPLLIIEQDEYRQLSVDQSRSLLGKE